MSTLFLDSGAFGHLVRLAGELGEMPIHETDAGFEHALRRLGRLVGADDAFWVLMRRNARPAGPGLAGWSPHHVHHLDPDGWRAALEEAKARVAAGKADRMTAAFGEGLGRDRSARPVDLMARRDWEEDWYVREHLAPRGVCDQLQVGTVVDPGAEVVMVFRCTGRSRFRMRDRDLLRVATGVLRRPLRELVLARGWLRSRRGLSPREREVLGLLLGGLRESIIAERLGIAPRTSHHHVTAVYERLGVRGRNGLLALWAGRPVED